MPATASTTSARSISSSRESSRRSPATPTSGTRTEETPRYSRVRRASSATAMSVVPAVTIATSPATRGIGFPTESWRVAERASYSARPGNGSAAISSQRSGGSLVTSTSCARAS